MPTFLSEVTAAGTTVVLSFREGVEIPDDLVVLMEIPSQVGEGGYWLLYRRTPDADEPREVSVDLAKCGKCTDDLVEVEREDDGPIVPHVFVEVRWEGNTALFPVRFDDKATLPLLLVGRKPTEGELIEYFLFGREPEDGEGREGNPERAGTHQGPNAPVDTRRILAYFIRRFVQAIPGIEAEVQRASYSETALEAALRGPTSPLELAERAYGSLFRPPAPDEPEKTPTAVGFQLTEILAAVLRCRGRVEDASLRKRFDPVVSRCRELLDKLVDAHPELKQGAFRSYQERFVGGKQ